MIASSNPRSNFIGHWHKWTLISVMKKRISAFEMKCSRKKSREYHGQKNEQIKKIRDQKEHTH